MLISADESKQWKHWAIQLVKHIFNRLLTLSMIHREDADEWTLKVFEKCLDASVEVLTVVVEVGEASVERQRNTHRQMPLGVPAPFNHRNDLNQLLNSHREAQKRRKLGTDEALAARLVAYELIAGLAAYAFTREKRPFELPILLLRCAVYEDERMQQYVSVALQGLLEDYISKLICGTGGLYRVAPLLPRLRSNRPCRCFLHC
jgi:hypothetical protein